MRLSRLLLPWFTLVFAVGCLTPTFAHAQLASPDTLGTIAGTVVDPQGAVVPQAAIAVMRAGGKQVTAASDALGRYSVNGLLPGVYTVEVHSQGFRALRKEGVRVAAGAQVSLTLTLAIAVEEQQVVVSDADVDSSPEKNGGAIVLKGKDLDALSNDPDELQMQLQAIAGSDPESGSQFYVDGFSGGKLPPKSSIREIRINQNPYSAQYDQLGYGRIEIFTKPGTDKLHGFYYMQGNDSALNTLSPFVKTQPGYYSYLYDGNVTGPITKTTSYFGDVFGQKGVNDAIVNAEVLDSSLNQVPFTQAISSPTSSTDLSARFDLQLGKVQTLSVRYELHRMTQTNGGVGQFALASQATDTNNVEQVLQFSDTQAYGGKVVNETRFQYTRDRNNQVAKTGGPTIAVQGAFTDGGGSGGVTRDNQDHYELQDYVQIAVGSHDLNVGGRLRAGRDANDSTANFNGQYTFASLDAYQITQRGMRDGMSAAAIRAAGGGASQYTQTEGIPKIAVTLVDAGIYAEDNWKVKPNITLSYGMRFETQTDIHDHADFGPRLAASWAISGGTNKPPRAVIRAGSGLFYTRFASGNVLQADRQNGITQSAVVVNSPNFFPADCTTNPSECVTSTDAAGSPTIVRINPTLRSPYIMMSGIGVDMPVTKYASISTNYMYSRGEHLFLTRNINAPLPGTYNPADPTSGTRPLGTNENIYEYESDGTSARNRLIVNANVHGKLGGLFGYYMLSRVDSNTSGIGSFPSNSYDLHSDYGRASYDLRSRMFLGGFVQLPWKLSMNPFIIYQSSTPFNIVVGQDLNGDTQFNDRPAFATDLSRASVYKTKYGNFDAQPIAGQTIIPINYGKGPGLFVANMRLSKSFSFGPVIPDPTPPAPAADERDKKGDAKTDTKSDGKTEGKSEAKTDAKPAPKPVKKEIERRYTLGLGVSANNIFNHVNLGPPIGVLGSPLFGTSTSLATIFGSGPANRTVNVETYFRF
jgi:hypothetical protein